MQRYATGRRRRGFTLIELMLALSIFSILLALAAPPMRSLLAETRARAALGQLRALFAAARQEAIMGGLPVTVCALDGDDRCSRDWTGDHRISVFLDRDDNRRLDGGDGLRRTITWPIDGARLHWRASLGRTYLTFTPSGATWQNGTLIYCPADGDARHARALVISQTGRSYVTGDTNGDGIREDRSGNNLDCG